MNSSDSELLAALWVKAQSTVAGFVRSMIADPQQAEEVLQETAVACVRKFHTFDRSRPFDAWAVGIARIQVLDWRRKHAQQKYVFDEELINRVADGYERLSSRAGQLSVALEECLKETDGRSRRALELFYGNSQKTDEIAVGMEMTGVAVRSLLSRTRAALRRCIERRLAREDAG